eukprot:CAMPEP_0179231464 /NCGR_PEP_ID=MMETSP0797-20121207/11357_1 /TAXON_ID=47934 /ORGANISM="Dinophysis acuminata, Strain DAEP01" /LENGTH=291 /DNA_ID=CAMNT_0020938553 /DNA_START=63 /DNA_END=936 /DNA_ORIENTATION=+
MDSILKIQTYFLQQSSDLLLERKRVLLGTEALHALAVAVHEELLEIPSDALPPIDQHPHLGHLPLRLLEEAVERGLRVAVDVDLREQLELCQFGLGKRLDLVVGTRLLLAELVAGEGEDLEAFRLIPLVQFFQLFVVDFSDGSFGRHVHYQDDLAAVVAERHVLALDVFYREVVEGAGTGAVSPSASKMGAPDAGAAGADIAGTGGGICGGVVGHGSLHARVAGAHDAAGDEDECEQARPHHVLEADMFQALMQANGEERDDAERQQRLPHAAAMAPPVGQMRPDVERELE